jgi:hypothetical protein
MEKDTRYEIIIQALCVYADKLEQKLREPVEPKPGWVPLAVDEASPELVKAIKRHIVTPKRGPGRPRKNK